MEVIYKLTSNHKGLPGGSDGNMSACNAGDPGSIPGSGRSPRGGNGNPLQKRWAGLEIWPHGWFLNKNKTAVMVQDTIADHKKDIQ